MARKRGSLGGEMRMRVNEHCATKSNKTRRNYLRSCASFDAWRKGDGLSNSTVRKNPRRAVEQWRDTLREQGYSDSTIHTYVAGVACGLQISMAGITPHGTSETKRKSLGQSERARAALEKESNADIVRFQMMVGGRRAALGRLKGSDLVIDESGQLSVLFTKDKGSKTQRQRILPEYQAAVRAYFEGVKPDQLLFPRISGELDLHYLRAQCAKYAYRYYEKYCSTPEGRAEMREQLWRRYTDPDIGCKAFLLAEAAGNKRQMQRHRYLFAQELADGKYRLRGANRRVAIKRGLPTSYDRLALAAVSLFHLSHFRNEVTVKHYML